MKRLTKKDLALSLYGAGRTVEEISKALETSPAYVANILAAEGKTSDYSDLYVNCAAQAGYAKQFAGLLRFRDVEAARRSVAALDQLYHEFEMQHDRRGQHQAQLMALVGKNRAEGIGKFEEAKVFADWLIQHLAVRHTEAHVQQELPLASEAA